MRRGKKPRHPTSRSTPLIPENAHAETEVPTQAVLALRQQVTERWNQAEAALQCQDRALALQCFQQVFALSDQLPTVRLNLIILLLEFERHEEALLLLAGLQAQQVHYSQAMNALGLFYDRHHKEDQALACWEEALRCYPANVEALNNQANAFSRMHRLEQALTCMDKALVIEPQRFAIRYNRGLIYQKLKDDERALVDYTQVMQQATEADPEYLWSQLNSANIWIERRQWQQARQLLVNVLRKQPDADYVLGTLVLTAIFTANWSDYFPQVQEVLAGIDAGKKMTPLLTLLALPANVQQQNRAAQIYMDDRVPDCRSKGYHVRRPGRLRVAYVSSDFGQHAVSFLMAGLFERHDRQRFEIFLYSLQHRREDPLLQRLQAQAEHFVDLSTWEDAAIVALAREHDLDIAVDLNGHTQGARTRLFALGLAPVQVHYLGFPGGMGAAYYDYILADAIVIPPAHRQYYREKVVYLPGCFQVNDEQREAPVPLRRAELGWPEAAFVFCCFNGTYKLNPLLFAVWMAVLRACPEAVLALLGESGEVVAHLRQEATAAGVEAQRLHFATRQPYARHLGRLAVADLVLDTLPFNGGTSSSDALWAGVPVLTCTGDTFAGRMSTSLLHRAGLTELIVGSLEDYVAVATALYNDQARLQGIRAQLQSNAVRQRLFATEPTTRAIEQAYLTMHQRRIAGLLPDSFSVGGGSCC